MALLYGNRLDNLLAGLASASDTLAGLGGNDTLDGGGGARWNDDLGVLDSAWFSGTLAGYRFSADAQGRLVVTDVNAADGSDGTDTLARIERLTFGNAALSLGAAEFRANTTTAGNQGFPSVAALPGGGFVLAWMGENGGIDQFNGFMQRFDARGFATGPETRLVSAVNYTTFDQPDVAVLGDGSSVVAMSLADSSGDFGILLRTFGPGGDATGFIDATGTSAGIDFRSPALAPLGPDRFLLAYREEGFFISNLRAESFGPDGSSTDILAASGVSYSPPDADGLAGVGTVLVWTALDASDVGIRAQRFGADGALAGGEFAVNDITTGTQDSPSVAMRPDGGFVVVWRTANASNSGDIAARIFNADGTAAGPQFFVNGQTPGLNENSPSVAALGDDGFVVSWILPPGSDGIIRNSLVARRFDNSGGPQGEAFRVTDSDSGFSSPALAGLEGGGFVAAWTGFDAGLTDRYDAMATVYNASGVRDPFITGTVSADTISLGGTFTLMVDGGAGNDSITGGGAVDFLQGGAGNDTIIGGDGDDNLLGSAGLDVLDGGTGADVLDGGAGADRMTGGPGDDEYVVDNPGDVITELAAGGNDTVRSAITLALQPTLENLVLTGSAGINATGNASGNLLVGNDGSNRLDGGAGADLMSGGAGNDTYLVDNELDAVGESGGAGIDTVVSGVSFTLGENVEFLTLSGSANLAGTGNAADNGISGNPGANILAGEAGNDTITGGAGNDTIDGGQGNDTLSGGAGNDLLDGRAGNDVFIFDAPLSATLNVDTVDDFDPAGDQIYLSRSVFTTLGTASSLDAGQFSSGAGINAASAPSHRIIYNTTTGDLYYDRDGSATAAAPVKFAVLVGSPDTLDNTDFFLMS